MGNHCSPQQLTLQDLFSQNNMTYLSKKHDFQLGHYSLFKCKQDFYIQFTKTFKSEPEYSLFLQKCQKQQNIVNVNNLKLQGFIPQVDKNICNTRYSVVLVYEFYQENLFKEYLKRRKQEIRFQEVEIWHILKSIATYLMDIDSDHGELTLDSVFIDNKSDIRVYNNRFINSREIIRDTAALIERNRIFKQRYIDQQDQIFIDPINFKSYDPDNTFRLNLDKKDRQK